MRKGADLNVYEAAAAFRASILAGEASLVKQLEGAWRVGLRRIKRRLAYVEREIAAAQAAGSDFSPSWLYRQERFVALIDQIEREIAILSATASVKVAKRAADLVKQGERDALAMIRATGVSGDFLHSNVKALEEIVGQLSDGSPLNELFQALGPEAVTSARLVFAEGLIEGSNPRKIAARLLEKIDVPRRRATLIARTETLRAYRSANQLVYRQNADIVSGVRISSSRDSRTCPYCLGQDGKILKHGEQFATHPGCRCALVPVIIGYTPDRGTGDEWLRTQPDAHALELLGPSRYKLWKSGEVDLASMLEYPNHPRWGLGVKFIPLKRLVGGGVV